MTTKITIEHWGTFFIKTEKVAELLSWLNANYTPPQPLGEINQTTPSNSNNQLING